MLKNILPYVLLQPLPLESLEGQLAKRAFMSALIPLYGGAVNTTAAAG